MAAHWGHDRVECLPLFVGGVVLAESEVRDPEGETPSLHRLCAERRLEGRPPEFPFAGTQTVVPSRRAVRRIALCDLARTIPPLPLRMIPERPPPSPLPTTTCGMVWYSR